MNRLTKITAVTLGSILIASLILFLPLQPAFAAQFGRPDSTLASGAWAPSGVPTRHEATDEVAPNGDTDFATITNNVGSTMFLSISALADPETSVGHIMRITCKAVNGGGDPENIKFNLLEDNTLIKVNNVTCNRSSYTTQSFSLSASQADSITDYTFLRFRVLPTALGASEEIRITQMELEVPDTPQGLLAAINGKVDQILATVGNIEGDLVDKKSFYQVEDEVTFQDATVKVDILVELVNCDPVPEMKRAFTIETLGLDGGQQGGFGTIDLFFGEARIDQSFNLGGTTQLNISGIGTEMLNSFSQNLKTIAASDEVRFPYEVNLNQGEGWILRVVVIGQMPQGCEVILDADAPNLPIPP